jgi:poly(A) polymerase
MTIRIATLNCRNTADRWRARSRVLVSELAGLRPDVIGLQELRHFPDQAGWVAEQAGARTASAQWLHRTYKTGVWWLWEGIAVLSRLPILERGRLALGGQHRVASFVRVRLPDGGSLDVFNTHLAFHSEAVRIAQVRRILAWMESRPPGPQVLVGDFNTRPTAPSIGLMRQSLRSVYATDPPPTVPTPLRRRTSQPAVVDYLFVNRRVAVHDARLAFDRPSPTQPGLYASDHFGVVATISVQDEP